MNDKEQRRHKRAPVPALARLIRDGKELGTYVVEDLSVGGARICQGPLLPGGATIVLKLSLCGFAPITIKAVVVRHMIERDRQSQAVRFRMLSTRAQAIISGAISRALDQSAPAPSLVFSSDPARLEQAALNFMSLGRRVVLCSDVIAAVRSLSAPEASVAHLLVEVTEDNGYHAEKVLALCKTEVPTATRLVSANEGSSHAAAALVSTRMANAALIAPWSIDQLLERLTAPNEGAESFGSQLEPEVLTAG